MIAMLFNLSGLDGLLAELAAADVALCVRGIRLIATPADALTPELLERMRAHKPALVEFAWLNGPCEMCGSIVFQDFSIHNGQSTRRDCICGHTRGFPVWYGETTGGAKL